ncbi:nuclear envelope integral membrane protein 1 isoform X1 [Cucumis melo var. makuwa]|uniref:Nuclear envelope integral membrane protein 1 isoform X1 n=1 Tax=Cucumis melo var. makuwa TaxID=1194695 RepID=A0A5D3CHE8_CUCMM|nr:nuclear envelope integral membrane protein 1 isoform X1 [Cucumis melo var. makuwa]TYK10658.1 nuclear envelope integral membrane protein 1 isoform X1 [Cucumis melo var. makuwa]
MPLKVVDATLSDFNAVFDKFRSQLPNNKANFILFLADKDPSTSRSWCPVFFASVYCTSDPEDHRLIVSESTTIQLSGGLPVKNSPGSKPGTVVACERVYIQGLPRNMSLGIGMCPQSQWEKVGRGSWVQSMSPFDHKLLDIRTSSILSKSLVFYYGSGMAIGILLIVLMILFQGMKLLPTGRKSSLVIFLYASAVGLGSFFIRYIPGLLYQILMEMGISEDMYNPLAAFLLAFIFLIGAWLGFWVVHKFVLDEDGSIDTSTSLFVTWSIRILASLLILQCSLDPLLATGVLICGIVASSMLRKIFKFRFLRRLFKNLFKSPKKIPKRSHISDMPRWDDSDDECTLKTTPLYKEPRFYRSQNRKFLLQSCDSSKHGDVYPSTFHSTPERRKFSKDEWEKFTKDSTKKALEGLVSSPDFSSWLVDRADRISITPQSSRAEKRRKWLHWLCHDSVIFPTSIPRGYVKTLLLHHLTTNNGSQKSMKLIKLLYCVRAEPVIYKKLEAASDDTALLRAYVGDRPTWRNPQHPWRVDCRFKLTGVPTLVRWEENDKISGRLEDHEAHVENKIDALIAGK